MVSEGNTLLVCGTKPMPAVTSTSARWLVMSWPLSSDLAGADLHQAEQRLEQRRLAGAVGADDADQLALLAVEVGAVEDVDAGQVAGDQVVGPEHGALGGREVRLALGGASSVGGSSQPSSSASSCSISARFAAPRRGSALPPRAELRCRGGHPR